MESGGACLKGVNSRALKLAHAADLAKDFPGVQVQGNAMSKARFEFRWHSIRTRPGNGAGLPRRTTPAEAHKVAHFCSMCGPNFCSMKITQDVRDYAQKLGLDDEAAIAKAMEEKAVEFKQSGVEIYKKA